ncbi:hypothetical protein QSH57_008472 [Fusarium oxysporum f. sp. vasinfectum]|nr:hypothetical protein QSH57_008472 [Fusarium oxysporum f. sp. vasinfectum]
MCSNFLADINNNHAQECRVDWGPRFVCGIKAITALGQLLLVTRLELDVSTLEVPGSYDNRETLNKKDTQRFDFTYAIPLLIALVLVLFFSGLLVRAIILSGMFLCALLILREGLEQSGYRTTLDDDIEDETRDLEIESEHLTQKHRLNTTIGKTLQDVGSSLAAALGAIQETHDSYRAMFERFDSIKEEKIYRLHETINRISHVISMNETYRGNSTTDQWLRESQDELRELVIELRLTFYIIFEWSSLYTRISQDIFTPALREVQSFSSLATLINGIDLSSDRLKLRPAQQGQSTPRQTASLFSRSSMPIATIPPTYSADSDIYFSRSSASMAKDTMTLYKVAEFAEIELNKLYRSKKRDNICTGESDRGLYHNYADSD